MLILISARKSGMKEAEARGSVLTSLPKPQPSRGPPVIAHTEATELLSIFYLFRLTSNKPHK